LVPEKLCREFLPTTATHLFATPATVYCSNDFHPYVHGTTLGGLSAPYMFHFKISCPLFPAYKVSLYLGLRRLNRPINGRRRIVFG